MSMIDNVKDAVKLVQQLDNIDLMRKMMDVQTDAMRLFEENDQLKREIGRLQEALKVKGQLFFEKNVRWLKKEDGSREGPYCSRCWDVDQKLIRILRHPSGGSACPECKTKIREIYH